MTRGWAAALATTEDLDVATLATLAAAIGGEPAEWTELVDLHLEQLQQLATGVREAANRQDHDRLQRLTHTLQGSAGQFGLQRLAACCRNLASTSSTHPPERRDALLLCFDDAVRRAIGALQAWRNTCPPIGDRSPTP
jgi:HPt (histidine-containing phosphotransfer) domain-containing protein